MARMHCSQLIDLFEKARSLGRVAPVALQAALTLVNRKSWVQLQVAQGFVPICHSVLYSPTLAWAFVLEVCGTKQDPFRTLGVLLMYAT